MKNIHGGTDMKSKEERIAKAEAQLSRRIARAGKPLEKKKKQHSTR